MRERYQQATRRERGALLDEYCRVTGCHRKAAIRRLGTAARGRGRPPGRPRRYGRALLPVLERVWLASDQLSGKLLHPLVPALVTALERHHGVVLAPRWSPPISSSPITRTPQLLTKAAFSSIPTLIPPDQISQIETSLRQAAAEVRERQLAKQVLDGVVQTVIIAARLAAKVV